MNKKDLPYHPWFWRDWFGDQEIRLLTPSERCVWFEMIGMMWQSDRRGFLLVGGKTPTLSTIANLIRISREDLDSALKSLEDLNVFSVTEDGIFYSRRILKDLERSESKSKSGKKGAESRYSTDSAIACAIADGDQLPLPHGIGVDKVLSLDNTNETEPLDIAICRVGPPQWRNHQALVVTGLMKARKNGHKINREEIIAGAVGHAAKCLAEKTESKYVGDIDNWLSEGRWLKTMAYEAPKAPKKRLVC